MIEIAEMYYWRINDLQDIDWVVKWHKAYMSKVGWFIIEKLRDEVSTYKLYRNLFIQYIEATAKHKRSKVRLDFGSHATMIYLGYKNQEKDIADLVEKTIQNFESSLFAQRATEIQEYFNDQA